MQHTHTPTPHVLHTQAPASGGEHSGLARAEQLLAQALKAVVARQGDASAANDALNACVKRLAEAKAESAKAKQSPAKGGGGGAGAAVPPSPNKQELDAKFALPKRLQDFTGGVRQGVRGAAARPSCREGCDEGRRWLRQRCCCPAPACAASRPLPSGPDDDRKAKLLWRQEKAAEEKRLAQER